MSAPLRLWLALLLATAAAFLLVPAVATAAGEVSLTIERGGTGEGKVKCEVNGHAAAECNQAGYSEGTVITLVPKPEKGSEFASFEGTGSAEACSGQKTCTFTLEEESSVEATFELIMYPVTIELGESNGTTDEVLCEVDENPGVICEGEEEYPYGTRLTLTTRADPSSEFAGFHKGTGSAVKCVTEPCTFTVEEESSVEALFIPLHHTLIVKRAGTGSGTVVSVAPRGAISCGSGCSGRLEAEKPVTLIAIANPGSTFAGWSGCESTDGEECTVTPEGEPTTVTATFNKSTRPAEEEEPEEGTARAAGTAQVKAGKAALKLFCSGGPCRGSLKLTAKVRQGRKAKTLTIGGASFNLTEESTKTLQIKLSGPAKQELAKGRALKAKLTGTGIAGSTVTLKPAKK